MRNFFACAVLLVACGGAPTQKTADVPATVTTTATPVAPSPPFFTGAFDIVSMSDGGSKTVVIADVLKQVNAHDGRMTWQLGTDSFTIGFWQADALDKLGDADTDRYSEFCRASGTVASHWEGSTLMLASTIKTESEGVVVRVSKKTHGGVTDRNVATRSSKCSASFTATHIAFEILEKDDRGPTRVRAKSDGVIVELVRGIPQTEIKPDKLFDEH